MKLTSAAFSPFRVPLRHPLVTAKGQISVREGFVLALLADSGELGLGEASPAYWIGEERIEHTREALESIAGSVERHTDTDELRQIILTRDDNVPLTPAARCALDTALLDLSARARGVSIARLLRAIRARRCRFLRCSQLAPRMPSRSRRARLWKTAMRR